MEKLISPKYESDIISNWKFDDRIYISIICTTYNQSLYIEDAINSFLAQKSDYKFEIVIHDDCSTDGTQKILINFRDRYPNLIKLILQNENQYSLGKKITPIAVKHSDGEFLAICEGDDFWIDKYKCNNQLKLLINSNYKICFSTAKYLYENGNVISKKNKGFNKKNILSLDEVIKRGGGAMETASLMIKKEVVDMLPKWFELVPVGDYYLQVLASKYHGAVFYDSDSCIYRVSSANSWSRKRLSNITINSVKNEFDKRMMGMDFLENSLSIKYKESIEFRREKYTFEAMSLSLRIKAFDEAKYFSSLINHTKNFSFLRQIVIYMSKRKSTLLILSFLYYFKRKKI